MELLHSVQQQKKNPNKILRKQPRLIRQILTRGYNYTVVFKQRELLYRKRKATCSAARNAGSAVRP